MSTPTTFLTCGTSCSEIMPSRAIGPRRLKSPEEHTKGATRRTDTAREVEDDGALLVEERGPPGTHRVDLLAGHLAPARVHLFALLRVFVKVGLVGGGEVVGMAMSMSEAFSTSMGCIAMIVVVGHVRVATSTSVRGWRRSGRDKGSALPDVRRDLRPISSLTSS